MKRLRFLRSPVCVALLISAALFFGGPRKAAPLTPAVDAERCVTIQFKSTASAQKFIEALEAAGAERIR